MSYMSLVVPQNQTRESTPPWEIANLQRQAETEGKRNNKNTKRPEKQDALVTSQIIDIDIRNI